MPVPEPDLISKLVLHFSRSKSPDDRLYIKTPQTDMKWLEIHDEATRSPI